MTMTRIFVVDGREFPDPDPELKPEDVRSLWADFMPELANAEVIEHKKDDETTLYELKRKVGTKG